MFDLVPFHSPSHQITVSPGIKAGAGDGRVKGVPLVSGAMIELEGPGILVERTVCFPHEAAVQGVSPALATPSRPIRVGRIKISIVVDIQVKRDADLVLIIVTLR